MRRALDLTVEYVKERKAFGKELSSARRIAGRNHLYAIDAASEMMAVSGR
ncbi:hypothetical protein [Cupriavidus sp. AcVe19-1a]|nr:hypothetical protein [Cupriavidus sp. AcVe19-1a]MBP0632348.1 hypothetical protein [Cupriavidus sp. AcVe19-1a]